VYYLTATALINDETCGADMRKKVAAVVQPFLTFPWTWLQLYSSYNMHLLVNNFSNQQQVDDGSDGSGSVGNGAGADSDGVKPNKSLKKTTSLLRSWSFNRGNIAASQDMMTPSGSLCRSLSETNHLQSVAQTVDDPGNDGSMVDEQARIDVDLALDNHEKFLVDWKYLFYVWLSLVDDGTDLVGLVHSSDTGGLWSMPKSYMDHHHKRQSGSSDAPSFQLDRFVIDTYVSFSFLNCVYECVSSCESEDGEPSGGGGKNIDMGMLFGRDRRHRQQVVLTTPTRRLLLQEVGIRFVSILSSWCNTVHDLLPSEARLVSGDDTTAIRQHLDDDFHASGGNDIPVAMENEYGVTDVETCCTILQDEDVFLWIDYIFTLRDILRMINISITLAVPAGSSSSGTGAREIMTPESSFPADTNNTNNTNSYFSNNSTSKRKMSSCHDNSTRNSEHDDQQ
jgi:hypothetical protein